MPTKTQDGDGNVEHEGSELEFPTTSEEDSAPFNNEVERAAVCAAFTLFGIKRTILKFSGGGDSGQIDEVEFLGDDDKPVEASGIDVHKIKVSVSVSEWDQTLKSYSTRLEAKELTLAEIIEEAFQRAASIADHDWWNNDGGSGAMIGRFVSGKLTFTLRMSLNVQTTDTYNYTF